MSLANSSRRAARRPSVKVLCAIAFAALISVAGCDTYQTSYDSASSAPVAQRGMMYMHGPGHSRFHTPENREKYAPLAINPVRSVAQAPVSTFSVDVDTGSYTNVRRFLNAGRLPPRRAVRVEEMINYFAYDYAAPETRETPFRVATEVARTPWNKNTFLMQIGLKAYEVPKSRRPAANLVFLIDVSGSMSSDDKLPLLKSAFRLLAGQMEPEDRITIVTYANGTRLALDTISGTETESIHDVLDDLRAGGGTNGGAGIKLAYAKARKAFIDGGINRVILATDGDLNIGIVNFDDLKALIEKERKSGIALTTLGFGTGNYNDRLLEQLADKGNGNHAYIDNLNEGRKVLVEKLTSTLLTVAQDVKVQVEFNPAVVAEYRLIGYENRALRQEDFKNDKKDAGDIGAGHRVTALYEIALVGSAGRLLETPRYAPVAERRGNTKEVAFVRIRYKDPGTSISKLIETPIRTASIRTDFDQASPSFRFASAVSAFGQILKGGTYTGDMNLNAVSNLSAGAIERDPDGLRHEFVRLVKLADALKASETRQVGANTETGN